MVTKSPGPDPLYLGVHPIVATHMPSDSIPGFLICKRGIRLSIQSSGLYRVHTTYEPGTTLGI